MKRIGIATCCLAWLLLLSGLLSPALGTTIRVPHDYPTIQQGIDAATSGDTVLTDADRSYVGQGNRDLDFGGRGIVLRTTADTEPHRTIIDCQRSGRGFNFHSGEGAAAVVRGFTIRRGVAVYGGGMLCAGASPTIEHCTIDSCEATASGGALSISHSTAQFRNCTLRGNAAQVDGGALRLVYAAPSFTECTLEENSAWRSGGALCAIASPADFYLTLIHLNSAGVSGGGIHTSAHTPTDEESEKGILDAPSFRRCTIVHNWATDAGGGMYCGDGTGPQAISAILWGNLPNQVAAPGANPSITYSAIEAGWPGEGNISDDPLFCNSLCYEREFTLATVSPCTTGFGGDLMGAFSIECDVPEQPEPREIMVAQGVDQLRRQLRESCDGDTLQLEPGGVYVEAALNTRKIRVLCRGDSANPPVVQGRAGAPIFSLLGQPTSGPVHVRDLILESGEVGMICERSSPIIEHCIIRNNNATESGGGLRCVSASPTITDCEIRDNQTTSNGGAIACLNSDPQIVRTTLVRNHANLSGGGVYCYRASPLIANCDIAGNRALASGGGVYCTLNSAPTLRSSTITNNRALIGGGLANENGSLPQVLACSVSQNNADDHGGGLAMIETGADLTHTRIELNAAQRGGGLYLEGVADWQMGNFEVFDNQASESGGGIYWQGGGSTQLLSNTLIVANEAQEFGGGLYGAMLGAENAIVNCTIWGNNSTLGGDGLALINSSGLVVNSILWQNGSEEILDMGGGTAVTYTDVLGSWPGVGNMDVNPRFRDVVLGDFRLQWEYCGDVVTDSPVIDAGSPALDDRLWGCDYGLGTILGDMGAYGGPYNLDHCELEVAVPDPPDTVRGGERVTYEVVIRNPCTETLTFGEGALMYRRGGFSQVFPPRHGNWRVDPGGSLTARVTHVWTMFGVGLTRGTVEIGRKVSESDSLGLDHATFETIAQ